jgi:hypothetical protein
MAVQEPLQAREDGCVNTEDEPYQCHLEDNVFHSGVSSCPTVYTGRDLPKEILTQLL